jgi:hypothetical protein
MEAVLERRTRANFRPVVVQQRPVKQEEEELTYEILQQHKREQQRLIALGIIEKPKITYGFTPEEQAEFDKGITIDDIFRKHNIPL